MKSRKKTIVFTLIFLIVFIAFSPAALAAIDGNMNTASVDFLSTNGSAATPSPAYTSFDIGTTSPTDMRGFALTVHGASSPSGIKSVTFFVTNNNLEREIAISAYKTENDIWAAYFSVDKFTSYVIQSGFYGSYDFYAVIKGNDGQETHTPVQKILVNPTRYNFSIGATSPTNKLDMALVLNNITDQSPIRDITFIVTNPFGVSKEVKGTLNGSTCSAYFHTSAFGSIIKGQYSFYALIKNEANLVTKTETKTIQIDGPTISANNLGGSSPTSKYAWAIATTATDPLGIKEVKYLIYNPNGESRYITATHNPSVNSNYYAAYFDAKAVFGENVPGEYKIYTRVYNQNGDYSVETHAEVLTRVVQ